MGPHLVLQDNDLVELMEELGVLTARINILPELLVARSSRLGVTIADRPNWGLDHGRTDEELRYSSQTGEEENITPGSRGRKLEPNELSDHDPNHDGELGKNPCDQM